MHGSTATAKPRKGTSSQHAASHRPGPSQCFNARHSLPRLHQTSYNMRLYDLFTHAKMTPSYAPRLCLHLAVLRRYISPLCSASPRSSTC